MQHLPKSIFEVHVSEMDKATKKLVAFCVSCSWRCNVRLLEHRSTELSGDKWWQSFTCWWWWWMFKHCFHLWTIIADPETSSSSLNRTNTLFRRSSL